MNKVPDSVCYDANQIFDHFGEAEQWEKLKEEIHEYLEDFSIEEAGDVFLVLLQLYLNNEEMQKSVASKKKRTLKRIFDEYYKTP